MKRLLHVKCGHGGTLDPLASGVLPILTGRATRLLDYLPPVKEYVAEITFGYETDTLDAEGATVAESGSIPHEQAVRDILPTFLGEITQVPPMYSAIKKNGVPLYKLARRGQAVDVPSRQVEIKEIEYLRQLSEQTHLIRVKCSKGTYIRTLCKDIAESLDTVATMTNLARTQSGIFRIEDSYSLTDIEAIYSLGRQEFLLPPERAVAHLPRVEIPSSLLMKAANGMKLEVDSEDLEVGTLYCEDRFLGLVQVREHISIPRVMMVDAAELRSRG